MRDRVELLGAAADALRRAGRLGYRLPGFLLR
jgi:hypothetical protein